MGAKSAAGRVTRPVVLGFAQVEYLFKTIGRWELGGRFGHTQATGSCEATEILWLKWLMNMQCFYY
jgi:hypothetical protein